VQAPAPSGKRFAAWRRLVFFKTRKRDACATLKRNDGTSEDLRPGDSRAKMIGVGKCRD
jgi:hypothetical protein